MYHKVTVTFTRFGFDQFKPRSTPCEVNPNSYQASSDTEARDENCVRQCQQTMGSLVYPITCARPDLSYCVKKLSKEFVYSRYQQLDNVQTCFSICETYS